jgi:hypothetical protein
VGRACWGGVHPNLATSQKDFAIVPQNFLLGKFWWQYLSIQEFKASPKPKIRLTYPLMFPANLPCAKTKQKLWGTKTPMPGRLL